MPKVIECRKLMAVEGDDEVNFFESFLKHMGITEVEVHQVGGKTQFKNKLPALAKTPGFSDVDVFAVIRDADESAEGAFDSIKNFLKKENLSPPEQMNTFAHETPKVGIFIMPGNSDTGMLEDLCLRTVRDNPALRCANAFVDCCESSLESPPKNIAKAKALTFLAAMPKVVNSVGIGAHKGYWDFDSGELAELKRFLSYFH